MLGFKKWWHWKSSRLPCYDGLYRSEIVWKFLPCQTWTSISELWANHTIKCSTIPGQLSHLCHFVFHCWGLFVWELFWNPTHRQKSRGGWQIINLKIHVLIISPFKCETGQNKIQIQIWCTLVKGGEIRPIRLLCTCVLCVLRPTIGKTSLENKRLTSPTPSFGQLGPLYTDIKNNILRLWQKKLLMMVMIVPW